MKTFDVRWSLDCIFLLWIFFFGAVALTEAQQSKRIARLGFLTGNRDAATIELFQRGLQDLGYIEGKNILVDYRYMDGNQDRIEAFVAELIQLKVDLIVSPLPQAVIAAKKATKTIPVVMMITADPVATGIVHNLAHPGGKYYRDHHTYPRLERKATRTPERGHPIGITRWRSLGYCEHTRFADGL